jgi:hypothetical protein
MIALLVPHRMQNRVPFDDRFFVFFCELIFSPLVESFLHDVDDFDFKVLFHKLHCFKFANVMVFGDFSPLFSSDFYPESRAG